MTDTEAPTETVWQGAEQLRPFLVPLAALEPFPDNPRRGDVPRLQNMLRQFGQLKPLVADPALGEGDRLRLVAGHHLAQAAAAEGWTHIAVLAHAFADEDDARGFLIADNRSSELGGFDTDLLVAQLARLSDQDYDLAVFGYAPDEVDALRALAAESAEKLSGLARNGQREHRDPSMKEIVLIYSTEQHVDMDRWLGMIGRETGVAGISEIVYDLARTRAAAL